MTEKKRAAPQRAVKSVETTARLLAALGRSRGSLTLSEMAADAGVSPSRAHAYAVGLIGARLVEQSTTERTYRLGPLARMIGTAAVAQFEASEVIDWATTELEATTRLSATAAVWHSSGPLIIRWVRGRHPLPLQLCVGSTMPLSTSALGRVFLALLPRETTRKILARELADIEKAGFAADFREKLDKDIEQFHSKGYAFVRGMLMPQMCSIAAPIIQDDQKVLAAVSVLGTNDFRGFGEEKKIARTLLRVSEEANEKLSGIMRARSSYAQSS